MKKNVICLFMFLITINVFGQQMQDVVYLKNGKTVRGTITEQILGESVKIKTRSGKIVYYKIDDIDKFSKEAATTQTSTFSTNEEIQKFAFDINGGYAFSWLSGFNDATGYDGALRSSYQVGIGLDMPINGNWGVETGVGYLALGGNSYSYYDGSYKVTGNVDLSYVEVPLLVKYDFLKKLNIKNGTSVGLKTGLKLGFNTQATDREDRLFGTNSNDFDAKTNLDWVVGVFSYRGHSGVSINFNYGLNDVVKSSYSSNNFRNKSIVCSYSYRF